MATVLARAVRRGVRMVVETHSGLLLLAVQALVAQGGEGLTPDLVKLHWFTRSEKDGTTRITSAELDDAGAFGDWPEDFGDVELDIESRYIDAAQARMSKK
jgi:predicted ATPase